MSTAPALRPGSGPGAPLGRFAQRQTSGKEQAAERRSQFEWDQASKRLRQIKIGLFVFLAVLFWFAVPYALPRNLPNADQKTQVSDNAEQFEGNASRQIAVPIIGLVACFMLWRLPVRGRIGGRLFITVLLYVSVVACSVLWSVDPNLTAKRLVVFGFDCLFAYALARTVTAMEMALWTFIVTWTVGALSVLADIFLLRVFAPFDPDYRLTGVMTANFQAMNLVACCLCGTVLLLHRRRWAGWVGFGVLTAVIMLVLTRARIGTILCFGLMAYMFLKLARERLNASQRAMASVAVLMFAVPGIVFVAARDPAAALQSAFMMGRKDTENTSNLSNRLPLWIELMDSVEQRPLLGWGYGAFWTEQQAARISRDQGWPVPHAHDTYLDQTIVLGVVGGSLYAVMMVSALAVSWRRYARVRSNGNLLNAALLTWLVLLSTTESTPLEPNQPTILVYVAVIRMCLTQDSLDEADTSEDEHIIQGIPQPTATVPANAGGLVFAPAATAANTAARTTTLWPCLQTHFRPETGSPLLAARTARSSPGGRRG